MNPEIEIEAVFATCLKVTNDALNVDLSDGRTVTVPVAWFPRLAHATTKERNKWRLIARGRGIHWPAIDEDISVAGLLLGRRSGERHSSFKRWLEKRAAKK